jgi:hypothetical protein
LCNGASFLPQTKAAYPAKTGQRKTLKQRLGAKRKVLDRRPFDEEFYFNTGPEARQLYPEFYWCIQLDDGKPPQYFWNETNVSPQEYREGGGEPC